MLQLAFKEFIIQKKSFLLGLVYIVFFMFVFQSLKEAMYPAAITAFTYILVMGAFALDDKNKADIMINCLPVKRSKVVTAKYISMLLFALCGTIVYVILQQIISWTGISLNIYPVNLLGIATAFFTVSLMNAIYFPLLFKLGYAIAKVINLILFFGFFYSIPALINKVAGNTDGKDLRYFLSILQNTPEYIIGMCILALTLIVLIVSWGLSVKLYTKMEF